MLQTHCQNDYHIILVAFLDWLKQHMQFIQTKAKYALFKIIKKC